MQKTFAALALLLLPAMPASAMCGRPDPRLLCAEYFQSDAVVVARFIKSRYVPDPDDDYFLYAMKVERVLRGRINPRFRMADSNTAHRTGFNEKNKSYLLFLFYVKEYKAWAVDSCGNSAPLEEAATTLQGIDQLRAGAKGGTIQGLVFPDPGATVTARGANGVFSATTVRPEGEFEIHVPAGEYRVSVRHAGKRFEPDLRSYEDPKRLRVRNGGCAQVQFLVSEQK